MLGFAAMYLLSILIVTDEAKKQGELPKDAEFIIRMEWQPHHDSDIDLWIRDPNKNIVGFQSKQTNNIYLERDNMGIDSNLSTKTHINEEIISIRTTEPGWYDINIHWYSQRLNQEMPSVKVEILKLRPSMQTIFSKIYIMRQPGEEYTMIRFKLDDKNDVVDKDESQIKFVIKKIASNPTSTQGRR